MMCLGVKGCTIERKEGGDERVSRAEVGWPVPSQGSGKDTCSAGDNSDHIAKNALKS